MKGTVVSGREREAADKKETIIAEICELCTIKLVVTRTNYQVFKIRNRKTTRHRLRFSTKAHISF